MEPKRPMVAVDRGASHSSLWQQVLLSCLLPNREFRSRIRHILVLPDPFWLEAIRQGNHNEGKD